MSEPTTTPVTPVPGEVAPDPAASPVAPPPVATTPVATTPAVPGQEDVAPRARRLWSTTVVAVVAAVSILLGGAVGAGAAVWGSSDVSTVQPGDGGPGGTFPGQGGPGENAPGQDGQQDDASSAESAP